MLWGSTSSCYSKLTVHVQLCLHPSDPFLINNRNMTGNSAEKNFCCVECKITSKT